MLGVQRTLIRLFCFGSAAWALTVLSNNALASCRFYNGVSSALTRTVNFGTLIVQRDTPIGTVLATANTGAYNGGRYFYGCSVNYVHRFAMEQFRVISAYGNNVYNTNIAGVGIRVLFFGGAMPYDVNFNGPSTVALPEPGITVQLVKTTSGAVGAGVLTNGRLASGSIVNYFYAAYASLSGTNTIIPVACSVSNTSIPVPMGNVPRSQFTGPGSAGDEINFSIPLDCDANTRVKVALDGNAHSSGIAGVLALNASPTAATGVGVRLYYNNAPVTLRTPIAAGTTVSDGPYAIPLVARYYQTDANVTAGQANSTATFTMTYN